MKKRPKRKSVLSLIILTVIPLLLLVVAFTWESTGDNLPNLLVLRLQAWGGKTNLSNSAGSNVHSWAPDIATGGGTEVYVVWRENPTGTDAEIYFKTSANGTSWPSGTGTNLTNNDADANRQHPSIAVEDGVTDILHVIWEDYAGDHDILYRKSSNGGSSWSPSLSGAATRVTTDSDYDRAPDIAVSSAVPYVVWYRDDTIFYSKDSGGGWTAPSIVSVSTKPNRYPAIASSGGRLHVTWDVFTGTNAYHLVHYRRSANGGATWTDLENIGVGPNRDEPTHPDVAARGDDVYVVWNTWVAANTYQIWCRRSDDGGSSWQSACNIATSTTTYVSPYPNPRVAVDSSGTVHVVWHGKGDNQTEIWYSSSDNGDTWSNPITISSAPSEPSHLPTIATDSNNVVHAAWQEEVGEYKDAFWISTGATDGGLYLPIIMKSY